MISYICCQAIILGTGLKWEIHNQCTKHLCANALHIFCPVTATHPHPSSQLTGLLGLCSQSFRCDCSWSSRSVAVQPKPALSQLIWSLDSMLRMMRGTGRRWASVTTVRSTGQICCWANHCVIQALQKACSQCGAWNEKKKKKIRHLKNRLKGW